MIRLPGNGRQPRTLPPPGGTNSQLAARWALLVVGRYDEQDGSFGALSNTDLFDPLSGHWRRLADLHQARWSHSASILLDGRVLVVAGSAYYYAPPYLSSAELFPGNAIFLPMMENVIPPYIPAGFYPVDRCTQGPLYIWGITPEP
jgi:hypothetical protein